MRYSGLDDAGEDGVDDGDEGGMVLISDCDDVDEDVAKGV